jgi:uncharacterized protein YdhG (YjbR/CyaY superfamily)
MEDVVGVDTYLAALPTEQRAALERVRSAVRSVAPEATETISYRMPAFKDRGRILVYYAAFTDHFSVFPASAFVRQALGAELEPHLAGKGTIRFGYGGRFPIGLVKKIVRARLAENEAGRRRS